MYTIWNTVSPYILVWYEGDTFLAKKCFGPLMSGIIDALLNIQQIAYL